MKVENPAVDFPRIEKLAQESQNETLKAFVSALQKVIVSPTMEQKWDTIEAADEAMTNILSGTDPEDEHYNFFDYWERKLSRVLLTLGKAVRTPGWEHEMLHQHLALKDTLLEMVMTYR